MRQGLRDWPARALKTLIVMLMAGCAPDGAGQSPVGAVLRYPVPELDGLTVQAWRAGDAGGRRVILVHGTPGSAGGWASYLANPPAGLEMVALDRPGFGSSTPEQAVTGLPEQAAALAPLMQTRAGKRPILVGHSLGGPVVARAAIDYPDRVGGLIIIAGSLDPDLEKVHFLQPVGEWWGVRALLPRTIRNANRELMALEDELREMAPRLGEIACPVTLIHGTQDPLVPYENVAFMQENLSAAAIELIRLAGQNHFLVWNNKPVIDRAIAAMAARLGEGDCG